MTITTQEIEFLVNQYQDELKELADTIWEYAEVCFEEFSSSRLQMESLKQHGFTAEIPCSSLPTAFLAKWGSGHPVVGLLGEYDALPGLSQKADTPYPAPPDASPQTAAMEKSDSCGHGCGHNLLGTAALGAALAVKDYLEKNQLPGTIIYYGCPAEENVAGKARMLECGFFEGTDVCFTWHPHYKPGLLNNSLANYRVSYHFHGTSAHASQSPHMGRSALDACELMNIGVNYLREHMIDEARIHYAYINAGGTAPNIIPADAEVIYAIRAPRTDQAEMLKNRVDNIARGAALMTETTVETDVKCIYESFLPNPVLDNLVLKYLEAFTPVAYTEEELAYAARFVPVGNLPDTDIPMDAEPDLSADRKTGFSTDAGNVSQKIPSSGFMVNCYANGSPLHHWSVTAQGKSSIAHKGMLTASKIMAGAAAELFTCPEIAAKASNKSSEKGRD